MKKSLIAVAVAGAVGAPMSAAQAAEVYGFVNIGVDAVSKDDGGINSGGASFAGGNGFGPDLIFVSGNDGSVNMADTPGTRFGVKGSEDLGNGLTAGYRLEFDFGTDAFGGGAPNEDSVVSTRLSNVSLSGDFGTVTAGTKWGALYEYLGWNVFRSDGHGGAGWYYATRALNDDTSGLRVSDALSYTYGAGGYGSDPFTFTVEGYLTPDTGTGTAENDETLDGVVLAAQGTFGDFQVNGVAYSENDSSVGATEPALTGIGVTWSAGDLYVGGNYMVTDLDDGGDDLETLIVLATYNFGGGNSGMAGLSTGDSGDRDEDMSSVFLQYQRQLSSATKFYVEVEQATVDNIGATGGDGEASVVSANVKHSF